MNKVTIPGMTTIVVSETTTVPVERVLAAAADFTARRGDVFPAVSAKHTTVHAITGTSADVTEPTCVSVMRRGYLLGDRLLRPAMVAVADPE